MARHKATLQAWTRRTRLLLLGLGGFLPFALSVGGCGNSAPPPNAPSSPSPVPTTTVLQQGTCTDVGVNDLCTITPITTNQAGTLKFTVDWTFPQDSIQIFVSGPPCSLSEINGGLCQILASTPAETAPKPAVLTIDDAAPGVYTLYAGNRGPKKEAFSFQETFTTTTTAASSVRPKSVAPGEIRPYAGAVEPR
jgi:hypothetical protein